MTGTNLGLDAMADSLFPVHVTGADRANAAFPPAERDENRAPRSGAGDCNEPLFGQRMGRIGSKARLVRKSMFNVGQGKAMPQAFGGIAVVPIKVQRMCAGLYVQSRGSQHCPLPAMQGRLWPMTPYRANRLYFTRFGSMESAPSRRTLSSS
jgi:hypothetical protein